MTLTVLIGVGLKISLALTVLSFGLRVPPNEAVYLFQRMGLLFRTVLAMNVIMPLFAIMVVLGFQLPPLLKAVLVALSVSPIPPLFPSKPLKAGGRESYITSLLVVSTVLSIILIPATFAVLEKIFQKHTEVPLDKIITDVFMAIIAPLTLAMLIHRIAPAFATKAAPLVSKAAVILLVIGALPILITAFPSIRLLIGTGAVLAIVAFILVGVSVGHFLGGPDEKDRTVLALSTSTRHPGIAVVLANANLTDHKLVPAAIVLYLIISGLVALPYLKLLRRNKNKLTDLSKKSIRT